MIQEVQNRVLLAALMYRATMRGFARALGERGLAPPRPEEKMRLHKNVEELAWQLPASAAACVEGRDVDEGVEDLPEVGREVERLVADAVSARESE